MDLLDVIDEMERDGDLPLCHCRIGRATGHDGYTLEHDPDSIYYGMWVHADPTCRRPSHPHVKGIQKP